MVSPTVDRRFGLVGNIPIKAPVAAIATSNITQSGEQTIDGVAVKAVNTAGVADRVLCTGQTDASKNGIWDVATGAWTRSLDANGAYDLGQGSTLLVNGGTSYAGSYWKLATSGVITIGTTLMSWTRALASSLSTLSFLQVGTGAVTRGAQDKMRDFVCVTDFGAVGDGVTDDYAAFQAAIDSLYPYGGSVYVPRTTARYRLSHQLVVKAGTRLYGDRAHDNPGLIAGVSYAFPTYFMGSVLYFDTGVAGILVYDSSDVTIAAYLAGDNTVKCKFSGGRQTIIEDLMLLNANNGAGSNTGAHGIEIRSQARVQNVTVVGFRGDGIRIDATSDAGTTDPYGSSSVSTLLSCRSRSNSGSGFALNGRDANVMQIIGCDGANNGAWGFNDTSFLGNTYISCHAATNNTKLTASANAYAGSYNASSVVAAHVYLGCYSETGLGNEARLQVLCAVYGGNLGSDGGNADGSRQIDLADTAYTELAGVAYRAARQHVSISGAKKVGARMGCGDTTMAVFAFGSEDDDGTTYNNFWRLKYNALTTNWYSWEPGGTPASTAMQFPSSAAAPRAYAPAFPNGFYLNAASGLGGTQLLIESGTAAQTLAAAVIRGDFRWNRGTTTDGIFGWRAMVGGAGGATMSLTVPGEQAGFDTLGDADATLTVFSSKVRQVDRTPLTSNRTLTLSTTNAFAGAEFKVTRTAASTGASTLSVGGLKTLAVSQWCVVGYTGAAWELLQFGSL